jgi:hypothetical protein
MAHQAGDYDACDRIAYENVEDAFNEGIDSIELRSARCLWRKPTAWIPQEW